MKKIILSLTIFVSLLAPVFAPAMTVSAQDKQAACDTIGGCNPQGVSVEGTVRSVISVLSYFVGAISIVMIIIGGFRYMVSGGESNGVAAAKNTIIYAIVGLVIALLAQALVRFVFRKATVPGS